eukprot:TRINITY_DN22979_c0_g1_i1.p1 TRINITY_DN22979_c0_g1~~TRINITY_DN22979_c0_g1_i1.p1  ORF type:complete len:671 (+),score=229.64 TRINITY_DN22979_c0_g1_i1:60-2072(+)
MAACGAGEAHPESAVPAEPPEPRRDAFGFVAANEEAYNKWAGTDEQRRLFEKVANAGGWANFLWSREAEALEWYGDETYYETLAWISQKRRGLERHSPGVIAAYEVIEKDIPRTFPGHVNAARLQEGSRRILEAYALRNPGVGYCQGMNYIAAVLSCVTSDEQAFWLLSYIVETLVPDYYRGLQGVVVDLQVLDVMIQRLEPRLWEHLTSIGFQCGSVFSQHLVCVFAYGTPPEAVLQLWGVIFHAPHPRVVLLRMVCGLMMLLKADLLSCTSLHGVMQSILEGCATLYHAQRLIDVAAHSEEVLSSSFVLELREDLAAALFRRSKLHREKLESVQLVKLQKELIQQIRAGWRGGLDDPLTKADLRDLVKETGINPDIENIILWEKEAVPFREVLFSLLLLQEGCVEDKFRAASSLCGDPEGPASGTSLALASQMSAVDPNLALAISMDDKGAHFLDGASTPPRSPTLSPTDGPTPSGTQPPPPALESDDSTEPELVVLSNGALGLPPRGCNINTSGLGPRPRSTHIDPLFQPAAQDALAGSVSSSTDWNEGRQASAASRPYYVPDGEALLCPLCAKEFRWFRRKHHCRACGQVVCHTCSPNRVSIPILNYHAPVRVCVACQWQMTRSPTEQHALPNAPFTAAKSPRSRTRSFQAYEGSPTPSSEGVQGT